MIGDDNRSLTVGRLEQAERILAAQHRVLELLANGRPLDEVLTALVRTVERGSPEGLGSVLLLDDDGKRLRHDAAPDLPEAYNRAIDGLRIGPRVGSCGTAAYRGERVIVEDIVSDPLWEDFHELAADHGLRACWSQPILSRDRKVLGTFAIYYREPRRPESIDCDYIEAAAHLAGIAIAHDRADRARQTAEQRLLNQAAVLVDLAKSEQLGHDFDAFAHLATETAAATLGAERVGIWFFNEERTALRLNDLYQLSLDRHTAGAELEAASYPRYFAALERGRVVAAHDARTHGDTGEFSESYLRPLGITSMLDAPIRNAGRLAGVVCHEHVGSRRVWTIEEQEFAASVADLVSLALESGERRRAEQAFRVAQEELLRQHWQARKQVETELERVKDELVRTTRLATIGQVAASIAHELRNPLGAIHNAAYYLGRRLPEGEPKLAEHLGIIEQELHAADGIIANLLEMSRGKEPVRQSVDLANCVREAFDRVKEARDMRLRVATDPEPFIVEADPDQMRQMLVNLITNSAQASDGCGRITVDARTEHGEKLITVRDEGPGIPIDVRSRIFEPLFSTKHKGTGLGLTISSQIAERHGWTLELAAADESGATFCIRMPVREAAIRAG